jgi:hypothetical protein
MSLNFFKGISMIKRLIFAVAMAFLSLKAPAKDMKNPDKSETTKEHACAYPANSINWILAYCAYEIGTGDEITLQDSSCFKKAAGDLNQKDECKINGKYKKKLCELRLKSTVAPYSGSVEKCLQDKEIIPFFAGG